MALKTGLIWGSATPPHPHLGLADLGGRRAGRALNLRFDFERFRKWECLAVLGQRATIPVEDEKPLRPGVESPGGADEAKETEPRAFHRDLNSLPSEFTWLQFSKLWFSFAVRIIIGISHVLVFGNQAFYWIFLLQMNLLGSKGLNFFGSWILDLALKLNPKNFDSLMK